MVRTRRSLLSDTNENISRHGGTITANIQSAEILSRPNEACTSAHRKHRTDSMNGSCGMYCIRGYGVTATTVVAIALIVNGDTKNGKSHSFAKFS